MSKTRTAWSEIQFCIIAFRIVKLKSEAGTELEHSQIARYIELKKIVALPVTAARDNNDCCLKAHNMDSMTSFLNSMHVAFFLCLVGEKISLFSTDM